MIAGDVHELECRGEECDRLAAPGGPAVQPFAAFVAKELSLLWEDAVLDQLRDPRVFEDRHLVQGPGPCGSHCE